MLDRHNRPRSEHPTSDGASSSSWKVKKRSTDITKKSEGREFFSEPSHSQLVFLEWSRGSGLWGCPEGHLMNASGLGCDGSARRDKSGIF